MKQVIKTTRLHKQRKCLDERLVPKDSWTIFVVINLALTQDNNHMILSDITCGWYVLKDTVPTDLSFTMCTRSPNRTRLARKFAQRVGGKRRLRQAYR